MKKIIIIMIALLLCAACGAQRSAIKIKSAASPLVKEGLPAKQVHFRTNRAQVIRKEQHLLDENAQWLANHPDEIVMLEGHCDERGPERFNMDLGDRRARWVKAYLVKYGLDPSKLVIISYGESRPLDPKHSFEAWKKNRRVEFKLGRE